MLALALAPRVVIAAPIFPSTGTTTFGCTPAIEVEIKYLSHRYSNKSREP